MAHHVFKQQAACTSCGSTGLYVGVGERDGAAVVCHTCKGTGEKTIRVEWDDFEGRGRRDGVERVYETNPGICIGTGKPARFALSDFGGMLYQDWLDGRQFERGMENRGFTCPAWWYQSANYNLKPKWDACLIAGSFSDCPHFTNKAACWSRWDRENPIAEVEG